MPEDLKKRIQELEAELKIVKLASMQWEEIQRTYQKSNDRLHLLYSELNGLNDRLTMAFEASQLAWWDWDFKTGKLLCSENMELLLGCKKDKLPATFSAFLEMVHPEDISKTKDTLEKHLKGSVAVFESEYRTKTESEEWKWIFLKGSVVEKDILGKPLRLLGIVMDVQRKKVHESNLLAEFEKADGANKAKSSFLATMAHEIYTPLSGVVGMAEILKQSELSPEQKEYLEIIVDSATNLLSVFNTIMDFLKIEAGQIEITKNVFSIYELMEDLISSVLPEAAEKELEIHSFIDPNIPLQVIGDASRLKQVLRVLADNGVKFTENGEITVSAHFLSWDEDTVSLQFKVTDTGIGISEEALKRIFTSFTRISPSTGKYGGSGLGLAIAKHLISRMKGDIYVESAPGKGSSFVFNVVLEKIPGSDPPLIDSKIKGLKTIVVDPSLSRARILVDYLGRMDCEAEHILTMTDAIQKISHMHKIKRPLDLVIIDFEAAKLAQGSFKASPAWDEVKKIMIHYPGATIPQKIAEMGFNYFLKHTFLPTELFAAVLNAVTSQLPEVTAKTPKQVIRKHEERKLRILLAEDNLINQKVAKVTLNKLGHFADIAENGLQAVELFKKNKYDLILMDIFMPEQDGFEATREIRQIEQADIQRKAIRICAITANADADDEAKCYEAGVDSYITKPFKLDELMEILDSIQ